MQLKMQGTCQAQRCKYFEKLLSGTELKNPFGKKTKDTIMYREATFYKSNETSDVQPENQIERDV